MLAALPPQGTADPGRRFLQERNINVSIGKAEVTFGIRSRPGREERALLVLHALSTRVGREPARIHGIIAQPGPQEEPAAGNLRCEGTRRFPFKGSHELFRPGPVQGPCFFERPVEEVGL